VVAIAELAWSEYRIAIVLTTADQFEFSDGGWFTVLLEELHNTFDTLASKLKGDT
jgi:hypothetical protein